MNENLEHAISALDDIDASLARMQMVLYIGSNVLSFLGGAFIAVCWLAIKDLNRIEEILKKARDEQAQ